MIKNNRRIVLQLFFVFIIFTLMLLLPSCKNYYRNSTHKDVSISSIEKGEALAKIYCQSCHVLPDPSMLDTKTWEKGVLPERGPRLGIFNFGFEIYPTVKDKNLSSDFYPSLSVMSLNDWQNILDYFVATSPNSLPAQKRKHEIKTGLSLFKAEIPALNYANPATCFVKINPSGSLHPIVISDAIRQNLYFINKKFQIADSVIDSGPVVDIDFTKNNLITCNIGVLNPNNGKFGKGELIVFDSKGKFQKEPTSPFDSLQRPVQITSIDLTNDKKEDYVICEFGYLTGALSWMEGSGNNNFKRHVLRNAPGAIKVYIQDMNHDGLPDIWALFSQGEEGIFLFKNKGNGNFDTEEVLRFPPSYGSSYFEFADFNKDGYPDIVYTCGDNADYSPVLKPYHGVYIFINDKTNHFNQKYFFPINGCYKAIARDYDGDGDLDIAAISFFADYARQPEEGFVYLKNNGNFDFQPYSITEANMGRWLTMDAGDFDGDGKTDIILGNFSIGPAMMKHEADWKHSPPFIILKNINK